MHFDEKDPATTMLAFNGEFIGLIKEADTTEGYIIQHDYEYRDGKIVATGKDLRQEGRVDFVGDSAKDSSRVLYDRLNKIRAELGLELYDSSFLDE